MKISGKWFTLVALLLVMLVLSGAMCDSNAAPAPESDSSQSFNSDARIPVDDNVYTITGQVVGEVSSITRQTQAGHGSISGFSSSGSGYVGGSFYGPEFGGKGFVRLYIEHSDSPLAPVEGIVLIKSSDTKGSALLPGDRVTFKCRAQYEAVAAVRENESFDTNKLATWELDYCRLSTPTIEIPR